MLFANKFQEWKSFWLVGFLSDFPDDFIAHAIKYILNLDQDDDYILGKKSIKLFYEIMKVSMLKL